MSARKEILSHIKENKPAEVRLLEIPLLDNAANDLSDFKKSLETVGGKLIEVNSLFEIPGIVQQLFPEAKQIASSIIQGTVTINATTDKDVLEKTDVAILKAELGVSENGAVWFPESNMLNRALPFITQHLVVVLEKGKIVSTMHRAYSICKVNTYDVFLAGPSKTADIEQSLVIGAHGARSLTVILI